MLQPWAQVAAVEVDVSRDGRRFVVRAEAVLRADVATAFATLTDYPNLPRFVPGVTGARVLERTPLGGDVRVLERTPASGDVRMLERTPAGDEVAAALGDERLQVEHRGEFRAFFFTRVLTVRMDVLHLQGSEVQARLVPSSAEAAAAPGGDNRLRSFRGRYRVSALPAEGSLPQVRVAYDAEFEPDFSVPPVLGTHAVRSSVTEQFTAMAAEIERRFAAR